ncbi:hypothetical protein GBA52_014983 [Prunus armeniaca]|nr:hypothetical protein GBA52_014983 [Prunus armeniaca]
MQGKAREVEKNGSSSSGRIGGGPGPGVPVPAVCGRCSAGAAGERARGRGRGIGRGGFPRVLRGAFLGTPRNRNNRPESECGQGKKFN